MKQTYYSYKMAPTVYGTRWQAVAAFVNTTTLTDQRTAEVLGYWMTGLDDADTPDGDTLRAVIADGSDVLITRAEPPPPPEPPITVTVPMVLSLARYTVTEWRATAADPGTTPENAQILVAAADALAAAIAAAGGPP